MTEMKTLQELIVSAYTLGYQGNDREEFMRLTGHALLKAKTLHPAPTERLTDTYRDFLWSAAVFGFERGAHDLHEEILGGTHVEVKP